MTMISRSILGPALFLGLSGLQSAQATTPVITINCNTAVHLADFKSCATTKSYALGSGSYVAFGASKFTIVKIVSVYGTLPIPPYTTGAWIPQSATTVKQSGAAAVTDADLNSANASLLAAIKGNIPGIHLDPNQVGSLLEAPLPEILTNQIDGALFSLMGAGYVYATPINTVIMVSTADGTNAQF